MKNNELKDLLRKKAQLESIHDHLSTEISYVDQLLRMVGFAGGLETVKATAKEMIQIKEEENELDRDDFAA